MVRGLYTAALGMLNEAMQMETIANNLANVNTNGYKKDTVSFSTTGSASQGMGAQTTPTISLISFYGGEEVPSIIASRFVTDFSVGEIRETGNPLDVALDGNGFLVIQTNKGPRYTRNGSFSLNASGELVNQAGLPVLGNNGVIKIQGGKIEIAASGKVLVDGVGVDTLKLVDFPTPYQLGKDGNGLFFSTQGTPFNLPSGSVNVLQGHLESANINGISETVNMIATLRNYEGYQKVIQSIDGTLEKVISEVGRV